MPRPSHRLDLLLVPAAPDAEPAEEPLRAALAGMLGPSGGSGPRAAELVEGGFARWRFDRPGRVVLYANGQGGFRVACPVNGASVVPAFDAARRAWRAGGPRSMPCPACGSAHALEDLSFAPPAAFARVALELSDAQASTLTEAGLALAQSAWGPVRVIGRRV